MSARNSIVSLVGGSRRLSCLPDRFASANNKMGHRDSVVETQLTNDLKPARGHELMTLSEYSNETDRTPQPPQTMETAVSLF